MCVKVRVMKHSSLTRYFKRKADNKGLQNDALEDILWYCDVSKTVGCLPPELRARLDKSELSIKTKLFSKYLSEFIRKNIAVIRRSDADIKYDLDDISNLFGTKCYIETARISPWGFSKWEGSFAVVGKVVFPEIHAKYALKMFVDFAMLEYDMHGKNYEIPVAFAAFNAEPKQNNVCYMASFVDTGYMLSKWMGEQDDIPVKKNKNPIFYTTSSEKEGRNCRQGKLIDFGETWKTSYGHADYVSRKLYRKIAQVPENQQAEYCKELLENAKSYVDKKKVESAIAIMKQVRNIRSCYNQKIY